MQVLERHIITAIYPHVDAKWAMFEAHHSQILFYC